MQSRFVGLARHAQPPISMPDQRAKQAAALEHQWQNANRNSLFGHHQYRPKIHGEHGRTGK